MPDSMPPCRSCGSNNLKSIISFGYTPLADGLITRENIDKPEYTAPLELAFCPDCGLVQITVSVPPVSLAMICARVVLPRPGGPWKRT